MVLKAVFLKATLSTIASALLTWLLFSVVVLISVVLLPYPCIFTLLTTEVLDLRLLSK
jgi:hypothetical protein